MNVNVHFNGIVDDELESVLEKKNIRLGKLLSEGMYGQVYKAERSNDAKKVVKLMIMREIYDWEALECEEIAQQKLKETKGHINVCVTQTIGRIEGSPARAFIVMPFYQNGNLMSYYRSRHLTNQQMDRIIMGLLEGIAFLHSIGMIHGDLKPVNILMDGHEHPKIADYGTVAILGKGKVQIRKYFKGTNGYRSPEVQFRDIVRKASDIFGIGASIYELLARRYYFHFGSPVEFKVRNFWHQNYASLENNGRVRHRGLLLKMLKYKANERPTAEECLQLLIESQAEEANRVAPPPRASSKRTLNITGTAFDRLGRKPNVRTKVIGKRKIQQVDGSVVHTMLKTFNGEIGPNSIKSAVRMAVSDFHFDKSGSSQNVDIGWFDLGDKDKLHFRTVINEKTTMAQLFVEIREAYIRLLHHHEGKDIEVLREEMENVLKIRKTTATASSKHEPAWDKKPISRRNRGKVLGSIQNIRR